MGQKRSELHNNDIEHNDVAKGHDNCSENICSKANCSCASHHVGDHINSCYGLSLARHYDGTLKHFAE